MIRLLPITTAQTITIIPRDYSSITGVDMIIVEDGTWETEQVTDINGVLNANGNFVVFQPTFSILKNENIYTLTLTDSDGGLLYRDKIYCSDQTNDEVIHTLNDGLYEQFEGDTDNKYIVLE
jgi:hypothetical protein